MKNILQKLLAFLTRKIINKYKPTVIGITGSIGKTSAKEAIFSVLKNKYRVRQSAKNYNNEIGLPLTVIGEESGGSSILGWLKVFIKAWKLLSKQDKSYPEILVLEMGADKPGDIEYLTNLVPCTISVVTKVAPAHIEFFGSIEAIAREKQKIITHLKKDNFAILNFDDDNVRAMEKNTKAQVLSFGYSADSKVRAIDLEDQGQGLEIQGIKFKISYNGSSVPVFLPGVIGAHQIYSAMAAAAVGGALGMNLIDISIGLKEYRAPKGRMNLIKGIKNSLIVDDTYNSSPEAAKAAVEAVAKINPKDVNAKIAIMGDMLELGSMTEEAHYTLGKLIAENGYNYIIAVGKYRDYIIKGARENGLEGFTQGFENSEIAKNQIRQIINDKDVVLVKGSQGSRMEKIVKALMLEPEKAEELLIRQTNSWLRN